MAKPPPRDMDQQIQVLRTAIAALANAVKELAAEVMANGDPADATLPERARLERHTERLVKLITALDGHQAILGDNLKLSRDAKAARRRKQRPPRTS